MAQALYNAVITYKSNPTSNRFSRMNVREASANKKKVLTFSNRLKQTCKLSSMVLKPLNKLGKTFIRLRSVLLIIKSLKKNECSWEEEID